MAINSTILKAGWFPTGMAYQGTADGLILMILKIFFIVIAIAAVGVIIWAGFKFIMSQGDTGKAEEAQKQIMYALIGLVVAIAAYTLVDLAWQKLTGSQLPTSVDSVIGTGGGNSGGGNSGGGNSGGGNSGGGTP